MAYRRKQYNQALDYPLQEKIVKYNSKGFKKGKESVQLTPWELEWIEKCECITEEIFNKIKNLI